MISCRKVITIMSRYLFSVYKSSLFKYTFTFKAESLLKSSNYKTKAFFKNTFETYYLHFFAKFVYHDDLNNSLVNNTECK